MRFCEIKGNQEKTELLEAVYNVLDGKEGGENLLQLYRPVRGGIFVEGPRWEGVWTHNTFVGMMGWLPYLEPKYRRFHRNSIELWIEKQREDGLIPECVRTDGYFAYYNDENFKGDVFVDGHWMGLSTICEYILFSRDVLWAEENLGKLRKAVDFTKSRKFKNGLMEVGVGGTVFEQCYGYEGYPSSTQIFYIRALHLMSEVEILLGNRQEAENLKREIPRFKKALLDNLLTKEGFFISALDKKGNPHGRYDYFESYPNAIAGPLEVVDDNIVKSIVKKINSIPELDSNVPMCSNYPGRPDEETNYEHGGDGFHMNGGAWMGLGGLDVWSHLIVADYERAEVLIRLLVDMQKNHYLQDRVEEFGKDKSGSTKTAGCDHPARHAVGGFGNVLRGLFDIQVTAKGLKLRPHIFPDIEEIKLKVPIYLGTKQVYLSVIKNERDIKGITVDGKDYKNHTNDRVKLDYGELSPISEVSLYGE